jgi:hypothetical protein
VFLLAVATPRVQYLVRVGLSKVERSSCNLSNCLSETCPALKAVKRLKVELSKPSKLSAGDEKEVDINEGVLSIEICNSLPHPFGVGAINGGFGNDVKSIDILLVLLSVLFVPCSFLFSSFVSSAVEDVGDLPCTDNDDIY